MGHRSEKTALRHGWPAGQRPPTSTTGVTRAQNATRYRSVPKQEWQAPKIGHLAENGKREWKPRHLQQEKRRAEST
jgi:hypothetical protein